MLCGTCVPNSQLYRLPALQTRQRLSCKDARHTSRRHACLQSKSTASPASAVMVFCCLARREREAREVSTRHEKRAEDKRRQERQEIEIRETREDQRRQEKRREVRCMRGCLGLCHGHCVLLVKSLVDRRLW